jgi:hypothetical protein
MKNCVFWDMEIQFVPHRKHITSPRYVRFEVFTAVTMKNVLFWDIKTQFIPHRKHMISPLKTPAG